MKKRLLSNRVRNAILMAILLQSVIFGFGLMVTGTFSGTANRPYKVMESQVAEKNSLISGYMNNSLLIANTMEKELAKIKDDRKIHDRLIDNLNHASSVDGVFYLNLDGREAVIYRATSTVWWEVPRVNIPLPSLRTGAPSSHLRTGQRRSGIGQNGPKGENGFSGITVCIMS